MGKVEEMVLRMQHSGYSKTFRDEVVYSAVKAYRVRQEAELKREINASIKRVEEG